MPPHKCVSTDQKALTYFTKVKLLKNYFSIRKVRLSLVISKCLSII
jgi:hypothetical protein